MACSWVSSGSFSRPVSENRLPIASSEPRPLYRAASWTLTFAVALAVIWFTGRSAWAHRGLLAGLRATPIADSFDDLSGLIYRTDRLAVAPPAPGTQEIFLTGSSVMGFWVRVPGLLRSLEDAFPGGRFRVDNFWAQNATISDTLLWVRQLPPGRPRTLILGVYFKSFQPRMRKPFIARAFPITNSALFRALFVSRTSDARARWDPNGDQAPTDGFWPAEPWSEAKGTGQAAKELLPLGRFPDNDETRAMTDLVELCHQREIRLVVIRTPINPAFRELYRGLVPYAAYDSFLRSFEPRITVWNMEDAIADAAAFVDMQHPVARGRDTFTRILAERSADWLTSDAFVRKTGE